MMQTPCPVPGLRGVRFRRTENGATTCPVPSLYAAGRTEVSLAVHIFVRAFMRARSCTAARGALRPPSTTSPIRGLAGEDLRAVTAGQRAQEPATRARYLTALAPAAEATPSCWPVPPLAPMAPMSLPLMM